MSEYLPTADDGVVIKRTDEEQPLQVFIDEFLSMKQEYLNLPDHEKTVPDQETLAYWNAEMGIHTADLRNTIRNRAIILKGRIDPIRDAGLLPARFEDEYQQLVTFINTTEP